MPIKNAANLEPGRGPDSVLQELKLRNHTAESLAHRLRIKLRYAASICVKLMGCNAIHRADWELPKRASQGVRMRAVYAFGPGENAPKPVHYEGKAVRSTRGSGRMTYHGHGIGLVNSVFQLAQPLPNLVLPTGVRITVHKGATDDSPD